MRGLSCFRPRPEDIIAAQEAPRTPRKKSHIKRSSTDKSTASRSSTASQRSTRSYASTNSSISQLPPCKRLSDAQLNSMMMPLPEDPRPSRCLRLSNPKIYSDIVNSMKVQRGGREWRTFDVFHNDEVDMTISADDVARRRAADYERKLRTLEEAFARSQERLSMDVDMIG